ncbi:unnamed protein product [Penicillium salamii]|nr:unnamed protein product [Penicillium salamii]
MNFFQNQICSCSGNNTLNIYNQSTDTARDAISMTTIPTTLQIKPSLPKINLLNYQISITHRSTITLETTQLQLKKSKTQPQISIIKLKIEQIQQHSQQGLKNNFYSKYFKNFHQLVNATMDVTQNLALQYHFNPTNNPSNNPHLIQAIILLKITLNKSQTKKTNTKQK